MSGGMLDAAAALQYGLVNYVVPQTELIAKTRSVLDVINTKAPLAIAGCIRAVNALYADADGYAEEVDTFGECFATEDMKEGATAFLEKRKANFKGK
jgi:enoyl-CoA hydratase